MSQGYQALTAFELKERLETRINDKLPSNIQLTFDPDTPEAQIIEAAAEVLGEISQQSQALYDQRRLTNAIGQDLEDLCFIGAGIERLEATPSTVELEPVGDANTPIPAGRQAEGPEGYVWESIEDGKIDGSTITFEAQTPGAISVEANADWRILTPVDGLDDYQNANPANVGRNRETDTALLKRRNEQFGRGTDNRSDSLRAALLDLPYVDHVSVLENDSSAQQTVQGYDLPAHSMSIVVYPTTLDASQKQEVADIIYSVKPQGIETVGSETFAVTGVDQNTIDIEYNFAEEVTVAVDVEPVVSSDFNEVKAEIEDAVDDFFSSLGVGEDVKFASLVGRVAQINNFDLVQDLNLKLDGKTNEPFDVGPNKFAVPSTTVTQP